MVACQELVCDIKIKVTVMVQVIADAVSVCISRVPRRVHYDPAAFNKRFVAGMIRIVGCGIFFVPLAACAYSEGKCRYDKAWDTLSLYQFLQQIGVALAHRASGFQNVRCTDYISAFAVIAVIIVTDVVYYPVIQEPQFFIIVFRTGGKTVGKLFNRLRNILNRNFGWIYPLRFN